MSRVFGPIRQIAFVVRDLDASLRYWTETLGVGPFFALRNVSPVQYQYRGQPSEPPPQQFRSLNRHFPRFRAPGPAGEPMQAPPAGGSGRDCHTGEIQGDGGERAERGARPPFDGDRLLGEITQVGQDMSVVLAVKVRNDAEIAEQRADWEKNFKELLKAYELVLRVTG